MSISNAVGRTFSSGQIGQGTNVDLFGTQTFTGSAVGNAITQGALTITGYNAATNAVTFTLSTLPNQTFAGTLLANTANSILLSAVISALGVTPFAIYLTNAAQPLGTIASIADESAASPVYVACYCKGTLIRTPDGPRPVENLQPGDIVHCLNGGTAPVRWIGQRSYSGRFLRANPALRPVRFKAGSLGVGLPSRDLLVSPKHAMLIDGLLIPAEVLVNNTTITFEVPADMVDYFHVELPGHDAIWAEDVLSETFVDDGSRGMFHNAGTFKEMHPEVAQTEAEFFAPRVESGPRVQEIRARLNRGVATAAAA